MSILDHLWDDTVAGPRPENGLGKLRKHPTFPTRSISDKESGEGGNVRSYSGDSPEDAMKVTRSIMIMKPAGYQSNGSAPASPAGSTPPVSPFSGAREPFRFRRRSTSDAYEKEKTGTNRPSPSSPFDV
ncbi:putative dormancy/auxin associated protein [Medicago truncatula]|uniref:Dormancy/auxin associated protein n=1 Tax=Medicago truncatula TaxID=3880 RepID=G7I8R1_MEDTR|nr:dormancy-associated protein homolog 3 isoform X2 [Medicago truncatula]AES61410.1 dormancy/auxin associated protein [Medicago truncatula]AFK35306.1 unknown [Medicago truncatula]RHN80808.1 putative dormancy/auxin associated protein [Medicago truncatula]